jgi:hypothetical protein
MNGSFQTARFAPCGDYAQVAQIEKPGHPGNARDFTGAGIGRAICVHRYANVLKCLPKYE